MGLWDKLRKRQTIEYHLQEDPSHRKGDGIDYDKLTQEIQDKRKIDDAERVRIAEQELQNEKNFKKVNAQRDQQTRKTSEKPPQLSETARLLIELKALAFVYSILGFDKPKRSSDEEVIDVEAIDITDEVSGTENRSLKQIGSDSGSTSILDRLPKAKRK